VNGLRGNSSLEERIRYDVYYIENWSLGFDLKILLKTIGALVRHA
jgi:lipopolysaccharide/colanic/teichoic acid biosynthesis glycosyltransferase